METALKHRLTGAVILVLLAVLLLPELLTGSGRAKQSQGSAAGPPGEAERSLDIDLTQGQGLANPLAVAPPIATGSASTPAEPLNLPVPPAAVPAPSVEVPVPPADLTAPPAAAAAPPAVAPADPPAAAPAGAYYVQLGVFVNRASANNLAQKLKAGNFAVGVDEIRRDNKVLHRVRVGPVADRASANALLKRLTEAGHKGSVVR